MAKLIFDNHGDEYTPQIFVGLKYTQYLLRVLEADDHQVLRTDDYANATHVMAHWSDNMNDSERQDAVLPESERFRKVCVENRSKGSEPLVILRVSSGGQEEQRTREDVIWRWPNTREPMAYVLNARNQRALHDEAVLSGFYSMTVREASAVIEGKIEDLRETLRQLFWRSSQPDMLTSLAILCQGSLAIRAKQYGGSSGPVRDALELMGWYSFLEIDGGKDVVKREVIDGDEELLASTDIFDSGGAFWKPLKGDEALKAAEAEWKSHSQATKHRQLSCWKDSSVYRLCKIINSSQESMSGSDQANLVAESYLELHELLEGE